MSCSVLVVGTVVTPDPDGAYITETIGNVVIVGGNAEKDPSTGVVTPTGGVPPSITVSGDPGLDIVTGGATFRAGILTAGTITGGGSVTYASLLKYGTD